MKTFKWTVPELPRSKVERLQAKRRNNSEYFEPTDSELKEYQWWENAKERGILYSLLRSSLIVIAVWAVLFLLRPFNIQVSNRANSLLYLVVWLATFSLGNYLSWRRYLDHRQKIKHYLNKQREPYTRGSGPGSGTHSP